MSGVFCKHIQIVNRLSKYFPTKDVIEILSSHKDAVIKFFDNSNSTIDSHLYIKEISGKKGLKDIIEYNTDIEVLDGNIIPGYYSEERLYYSKDYSILGKNVIHPLYKKDSSFIVYKRTTVRNSDVVKEYHSLIFYAGKVNG